MNSVVEQAFSGCPILQSEIKRSCLTSTSFNCIQKQNFYLKDSNYKVKTYLIKKIAILVARISEYREKDIHQVFSFGHLIRFLPKKEEIDNQIVEPFIWKNMGGIEYYNLLI